MAAKGIFSLLVLAMSMVGFSASLSSIDNHATSGAYIA